MYKDMNEIFGIVAEFEEVLSISRKPKKVK